MEIGKKRLPVGLPGGKKYAAAHRTALKRCPAAKALFGRACALVKSAMLVHAEDPPHTASYPRPVEVLLVDDSAADVRLTQEAFKEWHVPTHLSIVMDGLAALDFLHRHGKYPDAPRPDLILLDLNLPCKNGGEVLKDIKSDPDLHQIPVMILTTSKADADLYRAYDLYANCYIAKPVDLDEFLSVMRSIEQFWLNVASLPIH